MTDRPLALFSLSGSMAYAARLADRGLTPLSQLEERDFEDGEHKIRPLVEVEGVDAYVIHALHGDATHSVNDKLCRLLFLIATLKDHGAARVTAVVPYLCYARKDRRTKPFDPVTQRYIAQVFAAVGTDRVMVTEIHNLAAFENAFRCPTRHIETADMFAAHFAETARDGKVVVVSPDAGGVKRAEQFRQALEHKSGRGIDNAFVEKYRSAGVVSGGTLVGDVADKTAIILDDLIATGGTLIRAARACRAGGARNVFAAATHGLFTGGANDLFACQEIDGLVVGDTVPVPESMTTAGRARLTILDTTPLVAAAITKIHSGG